MNGEFYAKDNRVFHAPIETKTETGKSINVGFPVCAASEYVTAESVSKCLNASRHHETLVMALIATQGQIANAQIDLQTGHTKAQVARTLGEIAVSIETALAQVK